MYSKAAINAFQASLLAAFEADPTLKWVVVPLSYYEPLPPEMVKKERTLEETFRSSYADLKLIGSYHKVQAPIVVTKEIVENSLLWATIAMRGIPPEKYEVALGLAWVCGYNDTSSKFRAPQIFDASHALDLEKLDGFCKKRLEKFTILATGNSYHFYLKGNPLVDFDWQMRDFESRVIDEKWDDYRRQSGGYIRVSSFVKGEISVVRG